MSEPAKKVDVLVAPKVRDLTLLAAQLADWLAPRLPGADHVRVANLSYPFGAGQSHETILFDAHWRERGRERMRGLVVRIKPTTFTVYQDDMFVEQYRLMRVMHEGAYAPVAEPLWFEEKADLLGAPFFVMEKIVGRVPVSIPSYMEVGWVADATPAERARLWQNGVRALAGIQKTPLSAVEFLVRPGIGDGFAQEWDRWKRYLGLITSVRPLPYHEAVWRRLEANQPGNRPPGLVWGDARIGNMMVGDAFEILAVMDWEQTSIGGALHDLGWWLFNDRTKSLSRGGPFPGWGARDQTMALWRDVTGIATADIDWYEAFAGFKQMCLTVHMLDMKGATPPNGDYAATLTCRQVGLLLDGIEQGARAS